MMSDCMRVFQATSIATKLKLAERLVMEAVHEGVGYLCRADGEGLEATAKYLRDVCPITFRGHQVLAHGQLG